MTHLEQELVLNDLSETEEPNVNQINIAAIENLDSIISKYCDNF